VTIGGYDCTNFPRNLLSKQWIKFTNTSLTECEEHYFKKKIDLYIKSLNIIKSDMRKTKREKARTLLDRYKKASKEAF